MSSVLKENLEKFINHCTELEEDDDPSGDGYTREFQGLRESQIEEKKDNKFPAEVGKKECNIKKNRYKDILPFDYTRVKLQGNEEDGSDYINASYIKDVNGENGYIACQGPLPHTVNMFWRMLWEKKIEIVFMACKLTEGISPKKKCEKYWAEAGEEEEFGDITVQLEDETTLGEDFVKRRLLATKGSETHHVTQLHYTGWPDHDIPDKPGVINFMISEMRLERKNHDIPLVIHCSAGCGRTGSICAIDYAWTLFNQGKIGKDFSLNQIIKKFREQRQSMVQTPDQYRLVHLVIKDLFETWIQKYDINNEASGAEELYVNLKDNDYVNVELADEDVYVDVDDMPDDDNTYTDVSGDAVVLVSQKTVSQVQRNPSVSSNKDRPSSSEGRKSPLTSTSSVKSTYSNEAVNNLYSVAQPIHATKPKSSEHVESVVHVQKDVPVLPDRNYNLEEIKSDGVQIVEIQKPPEKKITGGHITRVPSDASSRRGHVLAAQKPHYQKTHSQNPPQFMIKNQHKHPPPSILSTSNAGIQKYKTIINVGGYPIPPSVTKLTVGKKTLELPNTQSQPRMPLDYPLYKHGFRGAVINFPFRISSPRKPEPPNFDLKYKVFTL